MEFNNNKPIFQQLADKICDEVMCGVYGDEERLPSVREYAAAMQVNANTMMRAYDLLAQRGVIFNKRGIGFFVCDDARKRINQWRQQDFFAGEIDYFFGRLKAMSVTPDDLASLYKKYLGD